MTTLTKRIIFIVFFSVLAIQGRELTTLQSILQNQVERFGRHMFQEGSVVVPKQVTYSNVTTNIQLSSTFIGKLSFQVNTTTQPTLLLSLVQQVV